ncbi:hypothetical protein G7054_g369 [Neopestalotiopsis clavispora]|nr:hypothetical protein G7054_g369 [Neopestalotiopsis clavispora]
MATFTKPIPVLLCGKFPTHTKATNEILRPEFEEATTAVKALLSGDVNKQALTLDGIAYDRPRVVIMGGGYSHADFAAIYDDDSLASGARSVPWVRPLGTKPGASPENRLPAQPPSAEEIAGRVRRTLDEHLGALREGEDCAGQIWWM